MNAPIEFRRARRIAALELSEIVQLTERSAALRAAGRDVIALSTGEPDFPTPPHVVEAAHQAALIGPDITVPFTDGHMHLGTWQQIVFLDFDNRNRSRRLVLQIMGE